MATPWELNSEQRKAHFGEGKEARQMNVSVTDSIRSTLGTIGSQGNKSGEGGIDLGLPGTNGIGEDGWPLPIRGRGLDSFKGMNLPDFTEIMAGSHRARVLCPQCGNKRTFYCNECAIALEFPEGAAGVEKKKRSGVRWKGRTRGGGGNKVNIVTGEPIDPSIYQESHMDPTVDSSDVLGECFDMFSLDVEVDETPVEEKEEEVDETPVEEKEEEEAELAVEEMDQEEGGPVIGPLGLEKGRKYSSQAEYVVARLRKSREARANRGSNIKVRNIVNSLAVPHPRDENLPDSIPTPELPFEVAIIYQAQEKLNKATSIQARVMAPEKVTLHLDEDIPNWDPERTVILFPSPDSLPLTEVDPESFDRVVALECTWTKVGSTLSLPGVRRLHRRVHIRDYKTLFWRHQKIGRSCVSTIEAIYYTAREGIVARNKDKQYHGEVDSLLFLFALRYLSIYQTVVDTGKPIRNLEDWHYAP